MASMDPSDSLSKQSPRKLRKSYTIAQKLEIVKYALANDRNISKTSREFNVDRKRVREWIKEESTLENAAPEDKKRRR